MTQLSDAPAPGPETGPETDTAETSGETGSGVAARVITREMAVMLVAPPVLIAAVFGIFVWWRQTAELDSVEASQLRWSEIRTLIWEHVQLTGVSAVIVVLLAVPLGIMLTRGGLRVAAPLVVGIANFGQAAPSVGLIALLFLWLGGGFWTAVYALSLYGILPVLRNTIVGIQGVQPTLVEAGRGIGMSNVATLFRIELPLAVPVIMSGVRTSLVLIAGTAALACFINAGGLGEILLTGITLFKFSLMVVGAVLIALLALLIEWLGRVLEVATRPKGV